MVEYSVNCFIGEAFEENIDIDFLNLDKADYSKIYVVLDERRIPHLIYTDGYLSSYPME